MITITADGALPVPGALVSITDGASGTLLRQLKTDSDGRTETVMLPAPPGSNSQKPDPGGASVYASYNIDVESEGFSPARYIGVPVFDGVMSLQRVNMLPLPIGGATAPPDISYFSESRSEPFGAAE